MLAWLFLFFAQSSSPTCATCHPKIAETFAKTGMGRSFYQPQDIGTTRYYHQPSDTWYAVEQRDGKYFQRRWRVGFDGKETEVLDSPIDYVMGSGNHVRTFLTKTSRGTLIELPLAWYAEKGGTWAMNPGHDGDRALPQRTVAYECMFCHNAYPQTPAGHEEPGREAVYTGEMPQGIGCERCHGGGAAHVRAAQTPGATVTAIRAAIVNPARLSKERQMEVCYQCHLETTSLQLPHSIVRLGRNPFSYKPGEPIADFMLFFDHAPGSKQEDDFEIAHSAYRLRKSRCFLESKGAMTCTTCHNPHDVPRGDAAIAGYNAVCGQCHAALPAQHVGKTNCVECHMPRRRTMDVVQAVMTDHYIQRKAPADAVAPRAERQNEAEYRGEVVPYYTAADPLYRALAQVSQRSNLSRGVPALATELAKQKLPRGEAYVVLGEGLLSSGKIREAIAAFEQAVARKPSSPIALLDLADALTQSGQAARATEVLNRGIRLAPGEPLLWYQLGIVRFAAEQNDGAVAAFEKAVALDEGFADGWNLLGEARAASGDMARAETAFRTALKQHPDLAEAQGNLGHVLLVANRLPEAEYYLSRASRLKPRDAEIHINYAVTLAGLNKMDAAMEQAKAAIQADPKSPEAHNYLGSLLARRGQANEALVEFLEAAKLRPSFGLAHLNAAGILAQQGKTAEARLHLQEAAKDPDPSIRRRAADRLR